MSEPPALDEDRLKAIFRALAEYRVEYAVFGAVALGLHGLARATADLDLLIPPDPPNVERLKDALRSVLHDPNIADIRPTTYAVTIRRCATTRRMDSASTS